MKLTEEMLYENVPKATEERVKAELEEMPCEPVEFSPQFEKKMERLIQKNRTPYIFLYKHSLKIAACFLVVVVISGTIMVLQAEALRQKFFDVINQFFDTYGIILFEVEEMADDNMDMKEPDYLPEGFEKTTELVTDNFTRYEYTDGKDIIAVNLTLIKDEMKIYYDTEYTRKEKINLTYGVADLYIKDGKYAKLVFYKDMLQYEIWINNSKFDKKIIQEIANSF